MRYANAAIIEELQRHIRQSGFLLLLMRHQNSFTGYVALYRWGMRNTLIISTSRNSFVSVVLTHDELMPTLVTDLNVLNSSHFTSRFFLLFIPPLSLALTLLISLYLTLLSLSLSLSFNSNAIKSSP